MIKLEQKQVKIVSVIIAVLFIGSVVALALTQSGGVASAAGTSSVGVIDRDQIVIQHPKMAEIRTQLEAAFAEVQKDFEEKSKSMNDQEKQDYSIQCQKRLQQKESELMDPLFKSIEEEIKKVADAKGLSIVVAKDVVVYGGQDITQDVMKKIVGK